MSPLFTIIIPVHNGEKFIKDAIKSAIDQSIQDISILILDNASSDQTVETVSQIKDPRIELKIYKNKVSLSDSLNRCFEQNILSKFFSILHADDKLHKDYVKEMISLAKMNNQAGIYFCNALIIDSVGIKINSKKMIFKNIFNSIFSIYKGSIGLLGISFWNHLIAPSATFRTNMKDKYPKFGNDLIFYTDLFFWIKFLVSGEKIIINRKKLYFLRQHVNQQSSKFIDKRLRKDEIQKLFSIETDYFSNLILRISKFSQNLLTNIYFLRK